MNSSLLILVFSLKGVFGADLQTILRRIARNAGGAIVDYAPFALFLHLFSAKKSINVYFGATLSVYGADLPWISELFCGKRRGKCITYSTAPPLFGLQTGVGDFTQKSPKDAVKRWCLTFLPTNYTHHMKKGSSENEPFYKS